MFSDPFTSVMVLIILSFIGVIVMFFFGLRGLGVLQKELRDRQMELENALLELEQRLTARIAESSRFSRDAPRGDASGREEPGNLLENASWRESGGGRRGPLRAAAMIRAFRTRKCSCLRWLMNLPCRSLRVCPSFPSPGASVNRSPRGRTA